MQIDKDLGITGWIESWSIDQIDKLVAVDLKYYDSKIGNAILHFRANTLDANKELKFTETKESGMPYKVNLTEKGGMMVYNHAKSIIDIFKLPLRPVDESQKLALKKTKSISVSFNSGNTATISLTR